MVLDITQYINETIVCYFLIIFKILFRWGTANWLLNTWLFLNRLVFLPCFYTNFSKRVIATCFTNLSCWSSSLAWFLQDICSSSAWKEFSMIKSLDLFWIWCSATKQLLWQSYTGWTLLPLNLGHIGTCMWNFVIHQNNVGE